LGVGLDAVFREQCFGERPHLAFMLCGGVATLDPEAARQDTPDIAIEYGRPTPESEDADRRGGRAADPRQCGVVVRIRGELAGTVGENGLRAAVQIACPRVIAESGPDFENAFDGGFSECLQRGKTRQEAMVVGNDGLYLRLLQHYFGQPDAVGVTSLLPRKLMAALRLLPSDHPTGEVQPNRQPEFSSHVQHNRVDRRKLRGDNCALNLLARPRQSVV
jgi:hypothetical protein